jgi:RNA-directed DNA polymerase
MSKPDTAYLIETAPKRYKVYQIPKKNGGMRTIAHPARELKTLQRALIQKSPEVLLVHKSATAYERGTSIIGNATRHSASVWVANFDFSNFFNSITSVSWRTFLEELKVDQEYIDISERAFFWRPKRSNTDILSVGSPSSPFVSNRIMHEFDVRISEFADREGFVYTRYADDITLSGESKFNLPAIEAKLGELVPEYLVLDINHVKTRQAGPGCRKVVTGLVVTDSGSVTLGKKMRKRIESYVEKFSRNAHHDISAEQIRGYLSYLKSVEPAAFLKVQKKFSEEAAALFSDES